MKKPPESGGFRAFLSAPFISELLHLICESPQFLICHASAAFRNAQKLFAGRDKPRNHLGGSLITRSLLVFASAAIFFFHNRDARSLSHNMPC
jgi:hypothetical protein